VTVLLHGERREMEMEMEMGFGMGCGVYALLISCRVHTFLPSLTRCASIASPRPIYPFTPLLLFHFRFRKNANPKPLLHL